MKCPDCNSEMNGVGSRYRCSGCATVYSVAFTCEICGTVPEEISSCGTVGYFCPKCRVLKSRTSMNKEFRPDLISGDPI